MRDEKLPRFHAGHDLVKFFYGGLRQLPGYRVDALLGWGVNITMVKGDQLLVFHHAREHQAFQSVQVLAVLDAGEVEVPQVHRAIIGLFFRST